jgi:hypothetical protein
MQKNIDKMCLNKRLYVSLKEAIKVLKHREKKTKKKLRIYKCPCCKGYHLTSKEF